MEDESLLTCHKCGAVMVKEDYLKYGWYLHGKRIDGWGCPKDEMPAGRAAPLKKPTGRARRARAPS